MDGAALHVNGDAEAQPGPSSPRAASPVPDAALHIDSYPLDVLPELDIEQQQMQELRTTVSPSELHSLSPHHQITLDGDGRPMHSDVLDDGLGMGVDAHMGEGDDDWAPADEWSTAEMRRVKVSLRGLLTAVFNPPGRVGLRTQGRVLERPWDRHVLGGLRRKHRKGGYYRKKRIHRR